jgi:polyphenol oxidase
MTMNLGPQTVPLLRSAVLAVQPGIAAGFSTRAGGKSAAPYGSLNLGRSTDDDPAVVADNRRRFFDALGFTPEAAAIAGQVHGTRVETVTTGGLYTGTDGLVTATPGVLLCITAADCGAVLLADPDAQVIGACHAGWRGAVGRIVAETVRAMQALGADPARMRAYVGPCIGPEAFEVGPEVAAQFDSAFVQDGPRGRPHVDLKGALRAQLVEAGLAEASIEVSPCCTVAEADRFFSHRASGGTTGRMMGAIGMRNGG